MKKIIEFMNKNKRYLLLGGVILLAVIISAFIYYKYNNDGMSNKNIYNVEYKVYQKNKWSKYSKNGKTAGDKENPIQEIRFKYNNSKGDILLNIYENKKWNIYSSGQNKTDEINGIKFKLSDTLEKKYSICYRTYNKKDKWLNWTCDGETSGNKKEPITAIEVKIIPKESIKFDYLKDYNEVLESEKGF